MAEDFTDGTGDQPISWWYFEEAASPSLDESANNNDLTWTGAAATQDSTHVQGSFSIKTTAESANLPMRAHASLSANFPFKAATTAFTIGGWVYWPGNAPGTGNNILYYAAGTQGFRFQSSDGDVAKAAAGLANTSKLPADSATSVGWRHLVLRWNGDNRAGAGVNDELSFWIDNVKQSTTQTPASVVLNTTSPFSLYGYATWQLRFDEWFAFNVALLDTQIADIYNHGLDGTRNPIATTGNLAWITA